MPLDLGEGDVHLSPRVGDGPNMVSESTASPNSVYFLAPSEFWGESSVSSFQPIMCLSELDELLAEFGAELSEYSLPKRYSRNCTLPVSNHVLVFSVLSVLIAPKPVLASYARIAWMCLAHSPGMKLLRWECVSMLHLSSEEQACRLGEVAQDQKKSI